MIELGVSKVLLGTASWGAEYGITNDTKLQPEELPNLVQMSRSLGFSGFDTAQDYEVQAEVFSAAGSAEIFSKVSHQLGFDYPERIRESLLSDLRAMGRDSFDGIAVHSVSQFLRAPKEATRVMEDLKELGLTKSWGISLYTLEECREVFRFASPNYIQAPVSAIDARFTTPSAIELFTQRGTVLHGRSIYLQGALLMSPETLPSNLQALAPHVAQIRELADRHSMPIAHFLIHCVKELEGVSRLIVGVNSAVQLEDTFSFFSEDMVEIAGLPPQFVFTRDEPALDPRKWKG